MRPEDRVELLRHADEGRALGQLPQRRGPDVGARRPDAAQEIEDDALHRPLRGHLDGLALAAPVLGDAAGVLRHGHRRGHAVEELDARPVGLDDLVARGLVRAGEQPAHHDEVRARAEGLGGVALSERVLNEAQPTLIGWRSLQDETKANLDDPDPFHHDSRRFEVATSCVPLLAGLRTSLDLLGKEGNAEDRLTRIQQLSNQLWHQLQALPGVTPLLDYAPPAGLVSFAIQPSSGEAGRAPAEIVKLLGAQGLWIRDLADPSCLRACTHVSTTEQELETLSSAVKSTIT